MMCIGLTKINKNKNQYSIIIPIAIFLLPGDFDSYGVCRKQKGAGWSVTLMSVHFSFVDGMARL